ncbi:MAG: hypothetical protein TREMPRED_003983 [Tremellales sp. Tagirdzhanova-0007]|nr:MAG: hypothetical protein TREMPRED_003983 [Tremellales sp. Tagirdzhanova-0007]
MLDHAKTEVVNLTGIGLDRETTRSVAAWMAKAFEDAPATPALTIFFGAAPYHGNEEMHESFWSSHLNRVAFSGILLGAKSDGQWRGFRCFFEPGQGRSPYSPAFRLNDEQHGNEDWDRFLALAGEDAYATRVKQWAEVTSATNEELALHVGECFTTSIIVTDPAFQRRGIGHALDRATQEVAKEAGRPLHVRIHEHVLPFYLAQEYHVLASPTYILGRSDPFKVHFLMSSLYGNTGDEKHPIHAIHEVQ